MEYFIVFDSETTGTVHPSAWNQPPWVLSAWDIRVIQLAFQVYDQAGALIDEYCNLIKPDTFVVPNEPFWIEHNLTHLRCQEEGVPLIDAISAFLATINKYEHVSLVAHNIAFDLGIISSEFVRAGAIIHGLDADKDLTPSGCKKLMLKANKRPDRYCTLKGTMDHVKLPPKEGKVGYKFPRLEESFKWCFPDENLTGGHDALNDVKATARIFFHCVNNGYIDIKNK